MFCTKNERISKLILAKANFTIDFRKTRCII
nr:MAG TPA: hypothetical protein [Caudoviricetes sp.]